MARHLLQSYPWLIDPKPGNPVAGRKKNDVQLALGARQVGSV